MDTYSVVSHVGLQAVFGGFIAGLSMRAANRQLDVDVMRSLDQVSSLLLPLFFIVTGLSLDIGGVGLEGGSCWHWSSPLRR